MNNDGDEVAPKFIFGGRGLTTSEPEEVIGVYRLYTTYKTKRHTTHKTNN